MSLNDGKSKGPHFKLKGRSERTRDFLPNDSRRNQLIVGELVSS